MSVSTAIDTSPEARKRRLNIVLIALYAEFFSTCFLMLALASSYQKGWHPDFRTFIVAIIAGFQVVSITYSFSEMSGAQCNCAISFSLWLTGKLSNRKTIFYIITQLVASLVSAGVIYCTFSNPTSEMFRSIAIFPTPGTDLSRVFATEYFCTFILAYTAFTVALEDAERQKQQNMSLEAVTDSVGLTLYATTPQSKAGFAPFAIGFVVFSLSVYGGSCGIAMNPARMFGPAVFSGEWFCFYLYSLAECCGAGTAALIVQFVHKHRADLIEQQQR